MSCILYFLTHSTEAADEEVNLESKEIIEDQLVSIISKDYLDVFSKCWCSRLFNSREFQLLLISFPFHRLASQLFPQCQLQNWIHVFHFSSGVYSKQGKRWLVKNGGHRRRRNERYPEFNVNVSYEVQDVKGSKVTSCGLRGYEVGTPFWFSL